MKLRTIECIKEVLEDINGLVIPVKRTTYEIEKKGFFGFRPLLDDSGNKVVFDSEEDLDCYLYLMLRNKKKEVRKIIRVIEV